MDDDQKQRKIWAKGEKATAILESEIWQECWVDFEAFIFDQFKNTESTDKDRLAHWKRIHVAGLAFKTFFERTVADGAFAAKALEFNEKRGLLQRVKSAIG